MWRMLLALAAVFFVVAPRDALAYLDPGTGSAIIQMDVAGVMGALFIIKLYWRKLAAFFTGKSDEEEAASSPAVPSASSPPGDERE